MPFKKYSYDRFAIVFLCLITLGCGSNSTENARSSGGKDARMVKSMEPPSSAGKAVLDELGVSELTPKHKISDNKGPSAEDRAKSDESKKAQAETEEGSIYQRPARWLNVDELPYEFWEVQYLGNRPVGYLFQKVTRSTVGFRIDSESSVRISRGKERLEQRLKVTSIEEVDGRMKIVEATMKQGTVESRNDGNVILGSLRLKKQANGAVVETEILWKNYYGGPFVVAQSLRGNPMKPGETRKLLMLDPTLGEMVQVILKAKEFLKTPLLDGMQHNLLEIDSEVKFGDKGLTSTLWVNKEGETQKTYTSALDIRSFRAERSFAESVRDSVMCESFSKTKIGLVVPIENYASAKSIVFKVRHPEIDPKRLMPGRTNQSVKSLTVFSAYVTVFAMSEKSPLPEGVPPELQEDPRCSKPSPVIQSEDAVIKKLATQFFEDKALGSSVLERFRRGVYNWVENKTPYTPLLTSAAETARSKSGDCIDHAMLLAAIVRARGVPARVAIGLVYNGSKEEPAMVLHSWTEVYLKDHWVSIDASKENSSTDATYVKLVDTPFADQNPYGPLMAALQAIELIEILPLD